jgi:hypothetical protein
VQVSVNGPAVTVCPFVQETSWSATRRVARPVVMSPKDTVVPKTPTVVPLPPIVTEHSRPEQDTRLTAVAAVAELDDVTLDVTLEELVVHPPRMLHEHARAAHSSSGAPRRATIRQCRVSRVMTVEGSTSPRPAQGAATAAGPFRSSDGLFAGAAVGGRVPDTVAFSRFREAV